MNESVAALVPLDRPRLAPQKTGTAGAALLSSDRAGGERSESDRAWAGESPPHDPVAHADLNDRRFPSIDFGFSP